ncbi:MAG TPA: hypothetical protein VGD81_04870 [Opitutaceae bacterium]
MNSEFQIEHLLRWTEARAQAGAPPPPSAARLLALTEPWWRRWPESFRSALAQLETQQVQFGHAAHSASSQNPGYPVPAVIQRTNVEIKALVDITYFHLPGNTLRLRFRLHDWPEPADQRIDVTFVEAGDARALFGASAVLSPAGEYRVEVEVPPAIAREWAGIRTTDRMPFRFILRPEAAA